MNHLKNTNMGYFKHLFHAWRMATILIVHGILPFVWETKVSDEIISSFGDELITSLKNKKYRD